MDHETVALRSFDASVATPRRVGIHPLERRGTEQPTTLALKGISSRSRIERSKESDGSRERQGAELAKPASGRHCAAKRPATERLADRLPSGRGPPPSRRHANPAAAGRPPYGGTVDYWRSRAPGRRRHRNYARWVRVCVGPGGLERGISPRRERWSWKHGPRSARPSPWGGGPDQNFLAADPRGAQSWRAQQRVAGSSGRLVAKALPGTPADAQKLLPWPKYGPPPPQTHVFEVLMSSACLPSFRTSVGALVVVMWLSGALRGTSGQGVTMASRSDRPDFHVERAGKSAARILPPPMEDAGWTTGPCPDRESIEGGGLFPSTAPEFALGEAGSVLSSFTFPSNLAPPPTNACLACLLTFTSLCTWARCHAYRRHICWLVPFSHIYPSRIPHNREDRRRRHLVAKGWEGFCFCPAERPFSRASAMAHAPVL